MIGEELSTLGPLTLEQLAGSAVGRRQDRKYVVARDEIGPLLGRLSSTHGALEIDGRRVFRYETLYFDTPGLDCYRAHLQGRRRRFKLRVRQYLPGPTTSEVKLKGRRGITVKRRLAADSPASPAPAGTEAFFRSTVLAEYGEPLLEPLLPVLWVQTTRISLAARDAAERVTCDLSVSFNGVDDAGGGRLDSSLAIVESKSERGRSTADDVLRQMGVRPLPLSKFCVGMLLTRKDIPPGPFRPMLRHFARDGAQDGRESRFAIMDAWKAPQLKTAGPATTGTIRLPSPPSMSAG